MTNPLNLAGWLKRLEVRHPSAIDLGLQRVGEVWQRLGKPRPAGRIFTVGGTNGKGSTVAYIDAMLRSLSYSCGSYTSPHVFRYQERARTGSQEFRDKEWVWAFDTVEQARADIGLSYFEHGTLAAFLLLKRAGLDFAVLEVGLGGRLDAVNLIDADCMVITPIGLDHQEYLGPDRESIGREKAGILRSGRPLICTEADPPDSVLQQAAALGVPVQRLGREFHITQHANHLLWRKGDQETNLPLPPLPGPHQFNNLAAAVAALACLVPAAVSSPQQLAQGIRKVRLSGRLQSHPDDARVLVDVGHNPLAAEVVKQMLQASGQRIRVCVLAMLRDKDAAEVVRILDDQVDQWYCAGLTGERGRSGADLAQLILDQALDRAYGQKVCAFETVSEALKAAVQTAAEPDRILVFGSFNTAAQALECSLPPVSGNSPYAAETLNESEFP